MWTFLYRALTCWGAHEYARTCDGSRLYLRCIRCGKRTHGVDTAR